MLPWVKFIEMSVHWELPINELCCVYLFQLCEAIKYSLMSVPAYVVEDLTRSFLCCYLVFYLGTFVFMPMELFLQIVHV